MLTRNMKQVALVIPALILGAIGWLHLFDDAASIGAEAQDVSSVEQPYQNLPQELRDRVHVVMIRSEFEYGGERHVFEAPVECGYKDVGRTLSGQNEVVLMNDRQYFTKQMEDGSVVVMDTPKLCKAWRSLWDTPHTGRKDLYVPENILPVYAWYPKLKGAKYFESYVSESYHHRHDARLRHISFLAEPGPYPAPDELILEARASVQAQSVLETFRVPNQRRFVWRRMFAMPFPEKRWKKIPAFREIIEELPPGGTLVSLDRFPENWDGDEEDFFKIDIHSFRTKGVPRRSEQTGVIGETRTRSELMEATFNTRALYTADMIVPMFCEGDVCRIDSTQSGYTTVQHKSTLTYQENKRFILEIDGERLELQQGPMGQSLLVFDRRTRTVFSLVNS